MSQEKKTSQKKFKGTVVSAKMDKTIVVKVDRMKLNTRYQKRYIVSENYKVHDEKNEHKEGEVVEFVSCRPLSKDKKWRVI